MPNSTDTVSRIENELPASAGREGSVDLFGIPVQAETLDLAIDRVDKAVSSGRHLHIGVVNASKIVNMRRNPALRESVLESDVVYADGMSVVWASRILGRALPSRVTGIDLMHGILERGQSRGYRVFCLGATQEVLDKVCDEFRTMYPGVTIAGAHDGYFSESEEEEVALQIARSDADILFVAITSPKKENFMARWGEVCDVKVVHGVGGSFDVVAGLVARAPEQWQRLGMEWLYRVLQEPGRLWKRYLVTNTVFLSIVLRDKLKQIGRRLAGVN